MLLRLLSGAFILGAHGAGDLGTTDVIMDDSDGSVRMVPVSKIDSAEEEFFSLKFSPTSFGNPGARVNVSSLACSPPLLSAPSPGFKKTTMSCGPPSSRISMEVVQSAKDGVFEGYDYRDAVSKIKITVSMSNPPAAAFELGLRVSFDMPCNPVKLFEIATVSMVRHKLRRLARVAVNALTTPISGPC